MRKAENLPQSCALVTKSGNLNFLEISGLVQACNGTALYLPIYIYIYIYTHTHKSDPVTGPVWPRRWVAAALEGVEWSAARPGPTLPLGKTR